jgi:hypothetical protein
MRVIPACLGALAVLLSACGPDKTTAAPTIPTAPDAQGQPAGTGSTGNPVAMDEQGGNAGPGLCRLFGKDQIGRWLGSPVGEGRVTGPLDSECEWSNADDSQDVTIQMALPSFFPSLPTSLPDYRELAGIGDRAASGTDSLGGMAAEAVRPGVDMIRVNVSGPANGVEVAVTILREAIDRTGGNTPLGAGPRIDQQGGGAGSGLCKLYTQAEIEAYLGRPAKPGKITGKRDSGCTWTVVGASNQYLTLEMLLPGEFDRPSLAPQYRELTGLGDQAYSASYGLNAYNAVALRRDRHLIRVIVKSPLTADDAVTILTETMSRVP